MATTLTTATRRALRVIPTSIRALAREADVWHTILAKIQHGEIGASPAVARAVAAALVRWGKRCLAAAEQLEAALEAHRRAGGRA